MRITIILLSVITTTSFALRVVAQRNSPITKKSLILSCKPGKLEKKPAASYIELIREHGVNFFLMPKDEANIRAACEYLGKTGLDDLIAAINKGAPVSAEPEPSKEEDPKITGTINNVFIYADNTPNTPLYFIVDIHIMNEGGPTIVQGFKARFSYFDKQFPDDATPMSCNGFRLVERRLNNKVVDLTDLQVRRPFKRQYPEDGWICFAVSSIPKPQDNSSLFDVVKGFTVDVIDGTEKPHAIGMPRTVELRDARLRGWIERR